MKRKNHYDPSQPMSMSNLPPEAIAAMTTEMAKNGISPDIIKQADVAVNPTTGVLQPTANVVSPVTPDLTNAEIITNNSQDKTTHLYTVEELKNGALPLLGLVDIDNIDFSGANKYVQENIVNTSKEASSILQDATSVETMAKAADGDASACLEVAAAAANLIQSGTLSSEVSYIVSQQTLILAGNVTNVVETTEDSDIAKTTVQIAVQTAVLDNNNQEAILQEQVDNVTNVDDYNKAVEALTAHQEASQQASNTLANLETTQPEIAQKASEAIIEKANEISSIKTTTTAATTKTNLFDKIVNYIYNTLYK